MERIKFILFTWRLLGTTSPVSSTAEPEDHFLKRKVNSSGRIFFFFFLSKSDLHTRIPKRSIEA